MAKRKRRSYGKTTKQWDKLYRDYRSKLKGERGLVRLTKTEFKKIWSSRPEGTTIRDIAHGTRKEDEYSKYERKYQSYERSGYEMGKKVSKEAFAQQLEEYGSVESLIEFQRNVTKKQGETWMDHLKTLKKKYKNVLDEFKKQIEENPNNTELMEGYNNFLQYQDILTLKKTDFFKENEKSQKFWDLIEIFGGWEEAFDYQD